MKIVLRKFDHGFTFSEEINLQDEELSKRLLAQFLNPDVQDQEVYIYEEGEIYYLIEYYVEEGFKEILFRLPDLPLDRQFLVDLVALFPI